MTAAAAVVATATAIAATATATTVAGPWGMTMAAAASPAVAGPWRPLVGWLEETSLQAVLLVLLILALQAVLRDRLAPRWRYALWAGAGRPPCAALGAAERVEPLQSRAGACRP